MRKRPARKEVAAGSSSSAAAALSCEKEEEESVRWMSVCCCAANRKNISLVCDGKHRKCFFARRALNLVKENTGGFAGQLVVIDFFRNNLSF